MNSILKPENGFGIEAKQAIVIYDLEKLANSVLSDANTKDITHTQLGTQKICQQGLPWNNDHFWNKLPNPNGGLKQKTVANNDFNKPAKGNPQLLFKIKECHQNRLQNNQMHTQSRNLSLIRNYFEKWKSHIKAKTTHRDRLNKQIEQKEKLDNFFKMLKRCQNKQLTCKTPIKMHCRRGNNEDLKEKPENETVNKTNETTCYKHRFKAQQDIIQLQKDKLIKQEKIIQQLKLGKLSEEINQSIEKTKNEIHETFTKCSVKVKCKVVPLHVESIPDDSITFQINSGKAPKIIQQMERRAVEREHKRQLILERKRLLDRQKKEAVELEIENKKVLDEEQRKRHLREIKKRRQIQLEIHRQAQINRQKFLENHMKAEHFCKTKLAKLVFKGFFKLVAIKENNMIKSLELYETSLKRKGWQTWMKVMMEVDHDKICKAEQLYHYKLKKKILKMWCNVYITSIQHLQVADDLFELRLQSKMFIYWHRFTCVQYVLQNKNTEKAHKHYNNRIILHYFYQWKKLPAVMELEKAKEEKKLRWREKVWEILPDYKPIVED